MRARQNKLVADKSTFIEFEIFGTWAWDHDCEWPVPDTHWMEYEEMCEQLQGVEDANEAAQTFLRDSHTQVRTNPISPNFSLYDKTSDRNAHQAIDWMSIRRGELASLT